MIIAFRHSSGTFPPSRLVKTVCEASQPCLHEHLSILRVCHRSLATSFLYLLDCQFYFFLGNVIFVYSFFNYHVFFVTFVILMFLIRPKKFGKLFLPSIVYFFLFSEKYSLFVFNSSWSRLPSFSVFSYNTMY